MNRSTQRTIASSAAVVLLLGACGWGIARYNLLWPLICVVPPDERRMIKQFEADPLYSVVPDGGVLVTEVATTYACDNGHGGSPLDPAFAEVTRLYATPNHYSLDQLHRLFDQPAAAAGWQVVSELSFTELPPYHRAYVRYCKDFGGRVSDAWIQARDSEQGHEVEVTLDARADGSACGA